MKGDKRMIDSMPNRGKLTLFREPKVLNGGFFKEFFRINEE